MPDIELKLLRDLIALAETTSLVKAAEARNVTHPAFGRRIRQLEQWAGTALVERNHQRSRLTADGRTLAIAAREVFQILAETRTVIQRADAPALRRVVIAAGRMLSHTILPDLVGEWGRAVPDLQWKVRTTSLDHGRRMLDEGEADLLLCHGDASRPADARDSACDVLRVGQDALIAVTGPLVSTWPRFRVPTDVTLPEVPYLAYADGMSLGQILRTHLDRLCVCSRLRCVYESDLADAIHAMVRRGAGLAWLPESLIRGDLQQGKLVRANQSSDDLPLDILLCRRRDAPVRRHLARVWSAVQVAGGT